MKLLLLILLSIFYSINSSAAQISTEAELIFNKYASAIYQVQSINIQTNKKNSIGTGFQVLKDGIIATNYHVISNALIYPKDYRIIVLKDKEELSAQIITIDVIHDLALLKVATTQDVEFPLGNSDMTNGKRLFSLGNPHDVGMVIIEGVSNGYMDKAIYKKILTTLPLNPGMSGGPTVDIDGVVVGVNVMTSGNSLSFLVPVEYLIELIEKAKKDNFSVVPNLTGEVEHQLIEFEKVYLKGVLSNKWEKQSFESFTVPTIISKEFNCWGDPRVDNQLWIESPLLSCSFKDEIYLSDNQIAQGINVNYAWFKSRTFSPFRLFNLATLSFDGINSKPDQYALEMNVENYECEQGMVKIANNPFWASTCARKLKQFPNLYDVNTQIASLNDFSGILMLNLSFQSISKETVNAFLDKFYKEIEWKK